MDISLSNYILHLPSIILTCAYAILHLSTTAPHQTVLTQIIVALGRPALRTPAALLQCQRFFDHDFLGSWGPWWLARGVIPAAESYLSGAEKPNAEGAGIVSVSEALAFAIRALSTNSTPSSLPMPPATNVPVEWSAYRPPLTFLHRPFRRRTSFETYQEIMSQLGDDCPVVLHLHGGAHCLMSPSTHRPFTTLLSYRSGALICAPAFRLAPQDPFPAALLDCFFTYLSLISPPPGSLNSTISPSRIIISGDSSGAGLAASLSLLLLHISRQRTQILFHGKTITIPPLPHAGLALISPWLDITRSLPSTTLNTEYDMLAPPPLDAASPPFPADEIWPTKPPRAETYCTAQMCTHPLVSPLAAKSEHWRGLAPVYVCTGWEAMTDEAEVFARRVHQAGVEVIFDGYEGMPHCFAMMPWCWAGWEANGRWAKVVSGVANGPRIWKESLSVEEGMGRWVSSKTRQVRKVRLSELGSGQVDFRGQAKEQLTEEVVERKLEQGQRWRVVLERDMAENGPEHENDCKS